MLSRRLVALLAASLLAGACGDQGPAGPPLVTGAPPILRPINFDTYRLRDNGSFAVFATRIGDLEPRLTKATMGEVLADGNRQARALCHHNPVHNSTGFCWESGDDATQDWYPQGLTATWDAAADGAYAGHVVILASWYHKSGDKGVRISFVNYDDPADVTYRHVLLVEPISSANFRAVSVHAGGVVWYGDYLYVMDTGRGMRVFDLRHIWRTEEDIKETRIGLGSDDKYYAFNYRYVLPQVGEYLQVSGGDCDPPPKTLDEPLCFSYSGIDRSTTPPSILVGEYYNGHTGARLVRYPIDSTTGLLMADAIGEVSAVAAYRAPHPNLQGVVSGADVFLMSRSRGEDADGRLYIARLWAPSDSSNLPVGPEDLSYAPLSGRVWSLGEHPGKRLVFSVPLRLE